jgi:hypothetical protein
VAILDAACLPTRVVSGAIDGNTVVFGIVSAEVVQANFVGTVVEGGLAIQGSFDLNDEACAVSARSWHIVKVAEPCDANGDGTVDHQDASDLLGFLLRRGPWLSGYADCNKDSVLNFRDVIAIIQSQ